MCTLAVYFKVFTEYPLIVAANRDEFLNRPASGPMLLDTKPRIVGGKDLQAGGTWLGINEHGSVAALLNRRAPKPAKANARSRGLLCLDALHCPDAADGGHYAAAQSASDYNRFNLLLASAHEAFVAYNRGSKIELAELEPGLHLLTNLDLDDFECPRISRSYRRFASLCTDPDFQRDPVTARPLLAEVLADHSTELDNRSETPNALCLHLDGYGTRSSSLIFIGAREGEMWHFFADGPPCRTPFHPAPIPIEKPVLTGRS
jgi:uncharacterized protein with NRDE domain